MKLQKTGLDTKLSAFASVRLLEKLVRSELPPLDIPSESDSLEARERSSKEQLFQSPDEMDPGGSAIPRGKVRRRTLTKMQKRVDT